MNPRENTVSWAEVCGIASRVAAVCQIHLHRFSLAADMRVDRFLPAARFPQFQPLNFQHKCLNLSLSSHPSAAYKQTQTHANFRLFIFVECERFGAPKLLIHISSHATAKCIDYYYFLWLIPFTAEIQSIWMCVAVRLITIVIDLSSFESDEKEKKGDNSETSVPLVRERWMRVLWQRQHRPHRRTNSVHTIVIIIKIIYVDSISDWSSIQQQRPPHPHRPHSRISCKPLPLPVIVRTNKWLMHYCQRLSQICNWTILVCLAYIILSKISLGKFGPSGLNIFSCLFLFAFPLYLCCPFHSYSAQFLIRIICSRHSRNAKKIIMLSPENLRNCEFSARSVIAGDSRQMCTMLNLNVKIVCKIMNLFAVYHKNRIDGQRKRSDENIHRKL